MLTLVVGSLPEADQRIGDAGIAGAGVKNHLVARQDCCALSFLDHAQGWTVLHRPAWVEPLRFAIDTDAVELFGDIDETEQRRLPDLLQDRIDRLWVAATPLLACHTHGITPWFGAPLLSEADNGIALPQELYDLTLTEALNVPFQVRQVAFDQ